MPDPQYMSYFSPLELHLLVEWLASPTFQAARAGKTLRMYALIYKPMFKSQRSPREKLPKTIQKQGLGEHVDAGPKTQAIPSFGC